MSLKAWIAAAALILISSTGYANVVAGRDFTALRKPQPTEVVGKVEVIEFINFACPGCYQMHRRIMAWAAKLPGNVSFRRVPVVYDGHKGWGPLARAFYALEATGDLHRLDTALFDAIHKERLPLFEERAITAWMVKHGVDGAKFTAAFNSFGVNTRISQNDRMLMNYQITSVPAVVVDGRYSVLGDSYDSMLSNASELIARANAGRAAKKS